MAVSGIKAISGLCELRAVTSKLDAVTRNVGWFCSLLRRSSTWPKEQRHLVLLCMLRGNVRSQVRLVLQTCGLADIFNNVKTFNDVSISDSKHSLILYEFLNGRVHAQNQGQNSQLFTTVFPRLSLFSQPFFQDVHLYFPRKRNEITFSQSLSVK